MHTLAALLSSDFLGTAVWLWLVFAAAVFALLAFDLGILHRDDHVIGVKESLWLSAGYVGMGLAFGAWVAWHLGASSGMDYLTGFLVEKTLAMDNVFVIAMIFAFFAVPLRYQHRVLFWGIVGVLALRAIMIGAGTALVTEFSWVLYLFGAFLVATGLKMLLFVHNDVDIGRNPVLRLLRRHLRITDMTHGNRFWVRLPEPSAPGGPPSTVPGARLVWWATPLFLALVLIFIGTKILAANWLGKVPAWISLAVTVGLLLTGVLYSLHRTRGTAQRAVLAK